MPKLRTLGSDEVVSILKRFEFECVSQKGSHLKLVRETPLQRQVLTIPNHKELAKGTTKAIFNQASRFVSQDELRQHFYTD